MGWKYLGKGSCDGSFHMFGYDGETNLEKFSDQICQIVKEAYNLSPGDITSTPFGGTPPSPPQIKINARTGNEKLAYILVKIEQGKMAGNFGLLVNEGSFPFEY